METVLGELAALVTSLLFSASSTIFTFAGRMVGTAVLNRVRLVIAVLLLLFAHLLLGLPLPLDAAPERWFWLGVSGIVGLALGDTFLFQAYISIGPRMSMLLMSLAPLISALLAWIFLGETLSIGKILGMGLTLGGIAWVIAERNGQQSEGQHKDHIRGLLYGLGAATGQALGLVTAKAGLGGGFPALSGTLIRMLCAGVVIWLVALFQGRARKTLQAGLRREVGLLIFLGAITGPFLGVTLSLYAVQHTAVGVASTLTALPPIFLLPVGYFVFKERFGWQAIAGTLVAICGIAVLFLV